MRIGRDIWASSEHTCGKWEEKWMELGRGERERGREKEGEATGSRLPSTAYTRGLINT